MTLGIAWVRELAGLRELIVISDSRLSGGQRWDANAKIMLLPRTDAVISFAGSTADAYPLMMQTYNSIFMHPPATNRSMDLSDLRGHLVRVFNHCREFIGGLPVNQVRPDDPEALFLLSGFDWRRGEFVIWTLHYDTSIASYTFKPAGRWGGQTGEVSKKIAFVGDEAVVAAAKSRIVDLLRARNKLTSGAFDMEPFEVLRDLLKEKNYTSIGGAIQLVKVYEHSNVAPFGVYWPNRDSGQICIMGRPLMSYEKCRWGVFDPDTATLIDAIDRIAAVDEVSLG